MTIGINETPEPTPETGSLPLAEDKFKLPNRWIPSLKARRYLYGVGLAALPVLMAYGIVDQNGIALWGALLGAVLGVTGLGVALVNTVERQEDKREREFNDHEKEIQEGSND